MTHFKNKIILITGASAGIGKSCAYIFAAEGARLILAARRIDELKKIKSDIVNKYKNEVHIISLDVRKYKEVSKKILELPEEWKNIDILINNAGLAKGLEKVHEADINNWEEMIDTNIKGLLYVTRQVLPGMIERNSGHIINLGSTAGHMSYSGASVYCATKYSVRAISDSIRIETIDTNIRVSSVDPGAVETEFSLVRFNGDTERAKQVYKGFKPLEAQDVAEAVLFCATRPPHANINEMIITPVSQANSLIIHRK